MRSKSTQISSNLNPKKKQKNINTKLQKTVSKLKITSTTNQRKSIKIKSKPTHPNPTQSTSKPNHQNRHQHQNKHQNHSNGIKTPSRPIPSRRQRLYSIAAKRFGIATWKETLVKHQLPHQTNWLSGTKSNQNHSRRCHGALSQAK